MNRPGLIWIVFWTIIGWYISKTVLTGLGLGLFAYLFILYIRNLGKTLPILELLLIMAAAQWILGAFLSYRLDFEHWKYFMHVPENQYMLLAVPGMMAFLFGLLFFKTKLPFENLYAGLKKLSNEQPKLGLYFIISGLMAPYLQGFLPVSLGFFFYMFSNLKFLGAALLLLRDNYPSKIRWMTLVMSLTLLDAIKRGMFHDLILWSALLVSFVSLEFQWGYRRKIGLIIVGIVFALLLQGIKGEYRGQLGEKFSVVDRVSLFHELVSREFLSFGDLLEESYLGLLNVRLNQGWIISAIIEHVPNEEAFANGETIYQALYASAVPRFLDPDKKIAGGRVNFTRFTGFYINKGTSMGTSILGEAYANFGQVGAWIFMFGWGAFLSFIFSRLLNYSLKYPLMLVFIPLIFLQVIKAETELVVVLNHLIKSLVFVFMTFWFLRKVLGISV